MMKKTAFVSFLLLLLLSAFLRFSVTSARANEDTNENTNGNTNEELHEQAKNLYNAGNYRAALDLYERILAENPEDGTALDLAVGCRKFLEDPKSQENMFAETQTPLQNKDALRTGIGLGSVYLGGQLYGGVLTPFQEMLRTAFDQGSTRAAEGAELAQEVLEKEVLKKEVPAEDPGEETPKEQTGDLTDSEARQKDALLEGQMSSSDIAESVISKDGTPEPQAAKAPKVKKGSMPKKREGKAQTAKASPKPKKPTPPMQPKPEPVWPETVYGVTLGSNIDEALMRLGYAGYPAVGRPFVKKGRTYYAIQGLPAVLPFSLMDRAVSWQFYVTAYQDAVSSVVIQLDYERSRSFEDLKNTARNEFSYLTGIDGVRGARAMNSVFGYEIGTALSNSHGLWIYVTDKGKGTCRLEIEHVDLTNLSYYWMAGGQ